MFSQLPIRLQEDHKRPLKTTGHGAKGAASSVGEASKVYLHELGREIVSVLMGSSLPDEGRAETLGMLSNCLAVIFPAHTINTCYRRHAQVWSGPRSLCVWRRSKQRHLLPICSAVRSVSLQFHCTTAGGAVWLAVHLGL